MSVSWALNALLTRALPHLLLNSGLLRRSMELQLLAMGYHLW